MCVWHTYVCVCCMMCVRACVCACCVWVCGVYVFHAHIRGQVVPVGQARIRVQISAAHTEEHIDRAVAAFVECGRSLGVIQNC